MDGFLLINKPEGITSREACDKVGKIFHTKKIGHVGTLDPFATGLLILGINKGTKCLTYFDASDKTYIATLKLGKRTDSLDYTGEVVEQKEVPELKEEEIKKVLASFVGKSKQLPPMTSAIHIDGVRLYELAHQGIEIDRPLKDIEVYGINFVSYQNHELTFECHVSKGTYIRSLGLDIAIKLGTIGHLKALCRKKIGLFSLNEAVNIEEVNENNIISSFSVLSKLCDTKIVSKKEAEDIKNGKIKYIKKDVSSDKLLIADEEHNVIAMYVLEEGRYRFLRGLF